MKTTGAGRTGEMLPDRPEGHSVRLCRKVENQPIVFGEATRVPEEQTTLEKAQ